MRRLFLYRSALAAFLVVVAAGGAWAQSGRAVGTVRDERGQPIKGATVTADNPDASPSSLTATTDDKGRFGMIGLKSGSWTFIASSPGYTGQSGDLVIRQSQTTTAPIVFTLKKVVAPPSALGSLAAKDIQQELAAADLLYNSSKFDESITAYRTILTEAPALSVINLQIAAAYRNKREYDNALVAYNDLLKMDPNNDKAKVGIAMTNLEKGDLAAAEQTLEIASQAAGATREVFYNLGEVKLAKSKPAEAIKAYERAATIDPAWGKPAYAIGRVALDRGDKATAATYFQKVIEIDPASPEAAQAQTQLDQLKR